MEIDIINIEFWEKHGANDGGVVFKIPFGMVSDNMRFGVFNIE